MDILYNSTRDSHLKLTASQAILKGLSDDGGLFVPDHIPSLDKSFEELKNMDYRQVAYEVMKLFFTDFTVCISCAKPSRAKFSQTIGTIIVSTASSAFVARMPSDGRQSTIIIS